VNKGKKAEAAKDLVAPLVHVQMRR
jgi:hypothetical protein